MSGVPYGHEPASMFGAGSASGAEDTTQPPSVFQLPAKAKRDPLVSWSHRTASTLHREAEPRLKEIERNVAYYNGDQWAKNRAPWKSNVVINYASWICDQWTAMLCDNKPHFVYEPVRINDEQQAEIATAMRSYDEMRDDWARKREEAVLISRIKKEAYYTLRYDPSLHGGEGGISLKVISPEFVFRDKMSTSLDDAKTVLYEYYESPQELLSQYPKLARSVALNRDSQSGYVQGEESGKEIAVPASTNQSTAGQLYSAPRHAPAAERPGGGSTGVLVREWWVKCEGPKYKIKVKRSRWNAGNRLATRKKFFKFADGTHEPLQTVITEGNVVYELPMSVVGLLQFASDMLDGLKVIDVQDALDPVFEEIKVSKYPGRRRIVVVGDYVADDGGNPLAHQEIPLVHLPARVNGRTKKALGDIDLVYKMCEYLNRNVALLLDCAHLTSNPVWIVPIDEQMSDEDLTNAPGAVIRTSPMAAKLMRREQGANMPSYVMQIIQYIVGEIQRISGLSETATGGKFKGQQSAETVSMYQESASVRFRQGIRLMEQAEVRLGRQYLALCGQFYNEPMEVKTKDSLGIDRHLEFLGSDLSRKMLMKVKAGSGLASSPSARLNQIMALYQQGLVDQPEIFKALQEAGSIESASAIEKRIEYYIKHPQQAYKMPALFAQLNGDNKKGKSNKHNAGRSARSTTANKAQRVA